MIMSVFQQGQKLEQIEHIALLKQAVGKDSIDMVLHSRLHGPAVLVGLKSGQAIVKPFEPTDEAMSFDELFDTAVTLHEYKKMQEQNVNTRDQLAPHLYQLELLLVQQRPISLMMRVKARTQSDLPALMHRLIREDKEFGIELFHRYAIAILKSHDGEIETVGALKLYDVAPDDAPDWQFVSPETDYDQEPSDDETEAD